MSATPDDGFPRQIVNGIALDYLKDRYVHQIQGRLSWLSWGFFRYYFKVSNRYVLKKLKMILFPYLHRNWKRKEVVIDFDHSPSSSRPIYHPPSTDEVAPDLYLPLMGFITYVILMSYILGADGTFHPEVLGDIASAAFIILFLENAALNLAFYLLSVPNSPAFLDTLAFTFYKFVPVNTSLVFGLLFGSWIYWLTILLLGSSMGMFVARSLNPILSSQRNPSMSERSRNKIFLFIVGILQIPLCLWLGKKASSQSL